MFKSTMESLASDAGSVKSYLPSTQNKESDETEKSP